MSFKAYLDNIKAKTGKSADDFRRPFGDGSALVHHAANLVTQRADAPPLEPAHFGVEVALEVVFKWEEQDEMAPPQLSGQRPDNLLIRESLG